MRWVSSNSGDIISFYSLPGGVQHVLPFLRRGEAIKVSATASSSTQAGDSRTSGYSSFSQQQQQLPEDGERDCWLPASSRGGSEDGSRQDGKTSPYTGAANEGAVAPELNRYMQASKEGCFLSTEGDGVAPATTVPLHREGGYYGNVFRQQSLGYVTTCVFSGGWGGYDETEVTVGTTEGYVYALPALWPPASRSPVSEEADQREEVQGITDVCRSCCMSASSTARGLSVSEVKGSTSTTHVSCTAAADGGAAAGRGERESELEETGAFPFPTSCVATPVKRYLRLPYTIQHLQMLGAHTPTLAAEYHDELFWLQQHQRRQRTAAPSPDLESKRRNNSGKKESGFFNLKEGSSDSSTSSHGCERCGDSSCPGCISCSSCSSAGFFSLYTDRSCISSSSSSSCSNSLSTSSAAQTSALADSAPVAHTGHRGQQSAARVQQFFTSDRLLLALDKGGNGVVAHWPAPPYLVNSNAALLGSHNGSDRKAYNDASTGPRCRMSGADPSAVADLAAAPEAQGSLDATVPAAPTPLVAFFSLNLSVQCCASNPVVTPLLAVVPSAGAGGGSRLLTVFDLVTSSFVFYARPPLTSGARFGREEPEQHQERQAPHSVTRQTHAPEAWASQPPRGPHRDRLWSNLCCLSRNPKEGGPLRQPGLSQSCRLSASCGTAATLRGIPAAGGAGAARNMPTGISSLAWLPALHPFLLAASSNSGLLLLYDLRASSHPVFCADPSNPPCAWAGVSDTVGAPYSAIKVAPGAALQDKHRLTSQKASAGWTHEGTATPTSSQKAVPQHILDAKKFEQKIDECSTRRNSSLGERCYHEQDREADGPMMCGARRVCCGSSRRCTEKGRRLHLETGQCGEEAKKTKPISIRFLTTPAWLTSAATAHDAAILPCDCRCCHARTAAFRDLEARSSSTIRSDACGIEPHEQQKLQNCPNGLSERQRGPAPLLPSSSTHGQAKDVCHRRLAGCTHDETLSASRNDVEAGADVVSLFGGCAANVVVKPRNSCRPRPPSRTRVAGNLGSLLLDSSHGMTDRPPRFASCSPAGRPACDCSNGGEASGDTSFSVEGSPPDGSSGGAACGDMCFAREVTMLRNIKRAQRRDTDWRKRWFARQEKAVAGFFSRMCTALLSERSGQNGVAAVASVNEGLFALATPPRALPLNGFCSRCAVDECRNRVAGTTSTARRPAAGGGAGGKRHAKDGWPAEDNGCLVSRAHAQHGLRVAGKPVESTGNTVAITGGVSCADTSRTRDRARPAELPSEVPHQLHVSRGTDLARPDSSSELPFDLVRLARSPCSILTGFPTRLWSTDQAVLLPPGCGGVELPMRVAKTCIAFLASCFMSLFARLLYHHRLDQHAVAYRLSQHQQRQLLKLLHALDCTQSAVSARGLSAADSAVCAAAAAEVALEEADSAALTARAASVALTAPAKSVGTGFDTAKTDANDQPRLEAQCELVRVPVTPESLERMKRAKKQCGDTTNTLRAVTRLPRACCSSGTCSHCTSEAFHTFCAPVASTQLLDFCRSLVSLYADVLLSNSSERSAPLRDETSTTSSPLKAALERIAPRMFSKHAQNCIYLLRYAADVLYAFGDGSPVVAAKSAAAGEAVQAAAATAVGLDSEVNLHRLFRLFPRGSARGVCAEDFTGQGNSADDSTASREQGKALTLDGAPTQQATKDKQANASMKQLRCGCGRVEAAVKAKARWWLADEFVTEARLAMRTPQNGGMTPTQPRRRPSTSIATDKLPLSCSERNACDRAVKRARTAHVVAATRAVASSICLCEFFKSATFFPVLFFNVFRKLCNLGAGVPCCIQRNCIRDLPVSDIEYGRLARSQLHHLTRNSKRRIPENFARSRRTRVTNDSAAKPSHEGEHAGEPSTPQMSYCDGCVSGSAFIGGTLPRCAPDAQCLEEPGRCRSNCSPGLHARHTRTQQLFCVDEGGRVYVLSVSLRVASRRLSEHGCDHQSHVKRRSARHAESIRHVRDWTKEGMTSRRNSDQSEGRSTTENLLQPRESLAGRCPPPCGSVRPQSSVIVGTLEEGRPRACERICSQFTDRTLCYLNRLTCGLRTAGSQSATVEQKLEEQPCSSYCDYRAATLGYSSVRKHILWASKEAEEPPQVDAHEEESHCLSEDGQGYRGRRTLQSMWKERWLRHRRALEWCAGCKPVGNQWAGATTAQPTKSKADGSDYPVVDPQDACFAGCEQRESTHGDATARAGAAGEPAVSSQPVRKTRSYRSATSSGTGGTRGKRKGVKRRARLLNGADKAEIVERARRSADGAQVAQTGASVSLLRLYPLLPLWNSLETPQSVRRSKLPRGGGSCMQNCIYSCLLWRSSHLQANCKRAQGENCGSAVQPRNTEGLCKFHSPCCRCAAGADGTLKASQDSACPSPAAPVANIRQTNSVPKEAGEERTFSVFLDKRESSQQGDSVGEGCSIRCNRVCCRLQVEEKACFDINGRLSRGQFGSNSCRSQVVSLGIHENGRHVLAATCAPSFLLYASSHVDPLPPYGLKNRLLFGCATGAVPLSRPFRLLCRSRAATSSSTTPACPSQSNGPTGLLPGAPTGPRPPPPVLLSASPIFPPAAASPFFPHTLLKRQADHGISHSLAPEGAFPTRRLGPCRPRQAAALGRQAAHAEYAGGILGSQHRAQAAFSDWLTDEEDKKELHGRASESETGSASDA